MRVQSHVAVSSSYVGGPAAVGPQTLQSDVVIIIINVGMGKKLEKEGKKTKIS